MENVEFDEWLLDNYFSNRYQYGFQELEDGYNRSHGFHGDHVRQRFGYKCNKA